MGGMGLGLKGEGPLAHGHFCPPQYQELQASAQLHGDSMKEIKVQVSQLQQAIQRLRSQIEDLKKQVRVPELPEPCLLLPLCHSHRWAGVNLDNWLDFK